ncbi:Rho GTPase activation protein [Paraphysoderma sedebokerense]|nr:Rho GTPase activation protein [Paraphysoderma sedebokerense]
MEKELEQLRSDKKELEAKVKSLEEKLETATAQYEDARRIMSEMAQAQDLLKMTEMQLQSETQVRESLETQLRQEKGKHDITKKKVESLEAQITDLETKLKGGEKSPTNTVPTNPPVTPLTPLNPPVAGSHPSSLNASMNKPSVDSSVAQHSGERVTISPSAMTEDTKAKNKSGDMLGRVSHCIPHRFNPSPIPSKCTWCAHMCGPWNDGMKCQDCKVTVHAACSKNVPPDCGLKGLDEVLHNINTNTATLARKKGVSTEDISHSQKSIYGVELSKLMENENDDLPYIMTLCMQAIEKRGINEMGIYRVSGLKTDIEKLKTYFSYGRPNLEDWNDIHTIAGAFKLWLRELPDSLFTFRLYTDFLDAVRNNNDPEEQRREIYRTLGKLPQLNYHVLKALFSHLHKICRNAATNKMHFSNLAVVFGPTLLRHTKDAVGDMGLQAAVVEILLSNFDHFFAGATPPKEPEKVTSAKATITRVTEINEPKKEEKEIPHPEPAKLEEDATTLSRPIIENKPEASTTVASPSPAPLQPEQSSPNPSEAESAEEDSVKLAASTSRLGSSQSRESVAEPNPTRLSGFLGDRKHRLTFKGLDIQLDFGGDLMNGDLTGDFAEKMEEEMRNKQQSV